MVASDNSYSRFIAAVKIVLPLAALALLSTLFLFSRTIDPTQAIPYSKVDVDQIVREQRVSAPNYTSVTKDGTAIAVTARTARPDITNPDRAEATDLTARLEFTDGTDVRITSDQGEIDTGKGFAVLDGDVVIDTSTGYHITTERLTTALDQTSVVADTTINADGPLGKLTAGHMTLEEDTDAPGQYLLVFKDRVKLIYDPQE